MLPTPYDEPLWYTVYCIVCYTVMWTGVYQLLCHLNPRRPQEWHCRVLTTVHALMVTSLALYSAFVEGPWPFTHPGGTTCLQQTTIKVCLAYFIFDMSWCLYHQTEEPVMLVHHALSLLGLTWAAVTRRYGTELVATIGGTEMTNPLLQLRYFLKAEGLYKDTLAGDIVDVVFTVMFGLCRLGAGGTLLYSYYSNPDTDVMGRFGGTAIFVLGCVFYYYILSFMAHKYKVFRGGRSQRGGRKEEVGTAKLSRRPPAVARTRSVSNGTMPAFHSDTDISSAH